MKKMVLIILSVVVFLAITALTTSYIDSARVRNGAEPKCVIKIVSQDGLKVTYLGLGYKVIRYPSVSPEEPYENSRAVKYGGWFMKYDLREELSVYKPTEFQNIEIGIFDVTDVGATVIIKDTNKEPYVYGEWYCIEKKSGDRWIKIPTVISEYGFNELGYLVNDDGEVKFNVNWEWLYGKLPQGDYRILKEAGKDIISAEFCVK